MSYGKHLKVNIFLHESPEAIARHTKAILSCKHFPLVLIMPHHTQGGTEILIYMPHREDRFTITTTVLNNYYLTIQEAAILTCDNNFDLDTYIILDEKNQAFLDERRTINLHKALVTHFAEKCRLPAISRRRLSRAQAHFKIQPKISYSEDPQHQHTCLFLITGDRSGLLATISHIFLNERIHLHNAKIVTAGERVEDMFFISNQDGKILSKDEQDSLRLKLVHGLASSN